MKKKCAEYSNYGRIQIENSVCFFSFYALQSKNSKNSSVSESDTQ